MRKGQNFFQLPVTCRRGTKAEGGQPGVGKAVKSRAGGSDRPVDRPSAGRPPSLVSYCLNRRRSEAGKAFKWFQAGINVRSQRVMRAFLTIVVSKRGSGPRWGHRETDIAYHCSHPIQAQLKQALPKAHEVLE